MYKPVLNSLIKINKLNYEEFYIESILEQHGDSVLRLPSYHPELNPIELIWRVKNIIVARNISDQLNVVHRILFRN